MGAVSSIIVEKVEKVEKEDHPGRRMNRFKLVDLASRVIPSAFFLLILVPKIGELYRHMVSENPVVRGEATLLAFSVEAIAISATLAFLALIAILFFIRLAPIEKAHGILPRVQAILGTFLMAAVTFFPRADLTLGQSAIAGAISLAGTTLSVLALIHLGRSFSLMAEARRLVTTGPYRFIRHPLYLFEGMATFGVLLRHLSLLTGLIFIAHVLIQFLRMRNEEAVLEKAFPEYGEYKAKTARLIPRVY